MGSLLSEYTNITSTKERQLTRPELKAYPAQPPGSQTSDLLQYFELRAGKQRVYSHLAANTLLLLLMVSCEQKRLLLVATHLWWCKSRGLLPEKGKAAVANSSPTEIWGTSQRKLPSWKVSRGRLFLEAVTKRIQQPFLSPTGKPFHQSLPHSSGPSHSCCPRGGRPGWQQVGSRGNPSRGRCGAQHLVSEAVQAFISASSYALPLLSTGYPRL